MLGGLYEMIDLFSLILGKFRTYKEKIVRLNSLFVCVATPQSGVAKSVNSEIEYATNGEDNFVMETPIYPLEKIIDVMHHTSKFFLLPENCGNMKSFFK